VLWSAKVRCEAGRRVYAKHGTAEDELWYRGTIAAVHRNDVGQWVDIDYDDGEKECMKPIRRVKALEESSADDESSADEDDSQGTTRPRGIVNWSTKVRCEAGRRVFSHYGEDADELWFRAVIVAVHRNDVGQWVDVQYDDGDTELMKPIRRIRAIHVPSDDDE